MHKQSELLPNGEWVRILLFRGVYPIDVCAGSLAFEVGLPVLTLLNALL